MIWNSIFYTNINLNHFLAGRKWEKVGEKRIEYMESLFLIQFSCFKMKCLGNTCTLFMCNKTIYAISCIIIIIIMDEFKKKKEESSRAL